MTRAEIDLRRPDLAMSKGSLVEVQITRLVREVGGEGVAPKVDRDSAFNVRLPA